MKPRRALARWLGCALAMLAARAPDVVVLDIHMPGKSGIAALPMLKRASAAPVVIVLTNDPSEHHRRECLARGAHFFFDKSRHFDRVLDVVADLAAVSVR